MNIQSKTNIMSIHQIIKQIDENIKTPFVTEKFGDTWKEHAANFTQDVLIDMAWTQGRRAILLERALEKQLQLNAAPKIRGWVIASYSVDGTVSYYTGHARNGSPSFSINNTHAAIYVTKDAADFTLSKLCVDACKVEEHIWQ